MQQIITLLHKLTTEPTKIMLVTINASTRTIRPEAISKVLVFWECASYAVNAHETAVDVL